MRYLFYFFVRYGLAGLFGVTRHLHDENERLKLRIFELERKGFQFQPSGYEDLDGITSQWSDDYPEINPPPVPLSGQEKDEIYGRNAKPVNQQRNTNDLYRMAKDKHEKSVAVKSPPDRIEEYIAQEEEVERAIAEARVNDRPLDVKLSESKQQFYVESAKAIMGTN